MRTYTPKEWIKDNLVTNKKINAILEKISNIPTLTVDSELSDTSENPVQNKVIKTALDNITPPSVTVDDALSTTSENPVQNKVITEQLNKICAVYHATSSNKPLTNHILEEIYQNFLVDKLSAFIVGTRIYLLFGVNVSGSTAKYHFASVSDGEFSTSPYDSTIGIIEAIYYEKAIGLDIRKFDDAMTYRIAVMVLAHMKEQKQ